MRQNGQKGHQQQEIKGGRGAKDSCDVTICDGRNWGHYLTTF